MKVERLVLKEHPKSFVINCFYVEWLERHDCDRHGLGSKRLAPYCCVPEKDTFPAWRFWQAVLNFIHISIKLKYQNKKFQPDCNILASSEAGRNNCFP